MDTVGRLRAWVQASRPLAQGNIAPPLLFGQALAWAETQRFGWDMLLWALAFGTVDQLFILFTNDWADADADADNQTFNVFSGGSRVIAQGKLSRTALGRGALVSLVLLLGLCGHVAYHHDRWLLPALSVLGVALVWAYSLPPLRLAYRGGGEILQALGVGGVLPVAGYYLQAGDLQLPPAVLAPCLIIGFAGSITTGLPDHPADARAEKRSHAVRVGQRAARNHSLSLLALSALLMAATVPSSTGVERLLIAAAGAAPLLYSLTQHRAADAENHAACLRFVVGNAAAMTLQWLTPAAVLAL